MIGWRAALSRLASMPVCPSILAADEDDARQEWQVAMRVDLLRPTDPDWDSRLGEFRKDVYHLRGYHAFEESLGNGLAYLAILEDGAHRLAWPYLLRPVDPSLDAGLGYKDVTSVYGYPGPIALTTELGDSFFTKAWLELVSLWSEQKVVSVFTRFHPLLDNASLGVHFTAGEADAAAASPGLLLHGSTLSLDCLRADEAVFASYHRSLRQHLRVSRRKGMATSEDLEWREVASFAAIYAETMARNRAAGHYMYSVEDLSAFRAALAGHAHLLVTRIDGEIAAAGIFTELDGIVQAHLVASRASFRLLSPTKVLLDDARIWARERGDRSLHLGGGRGGKDDSLFRFKREFSSQMHQFYTGRWILDPPAYRDLTEARKETGATPADPEFFPEYRAPLATAPHEDPANVPSLEPQEPADELAASRDQVQPGPHRDARTASGGLPGGQAVPIRRAVRPNVLITSAGRRVGLVRAFQQAVHPLGGRVITTDHNPALAAACQVADAAVEVPRITHPEYLSTTRAIVDAYEVGLVVPTHDLELLGFASVRDDWEARGIHVSVPSADLVRQCRNKRLTAELFESLGIPALREVSDGFPRFVKPISGSLSQDVHTVLGPEELTHRINDRAQFVHQELVDSRIYAEYTVDALYTESGELVCAVPRHRLEVRGGEISKGRTVKGPVLEIVRERLSTIPGARGCLCMQFFHSTDRGDRPIIGIEVNARFGGGYPMSDASGATFARWIVQESIMGQALHYREDWQEQTFLRFDEQVIVRA